MKRKERIVQIVLIFMLSVMAVVFIAPVISIISVSISDETRIAREGYGLFPKGISFEAYEYLFEYPEKILKAYGVTFLFTVVTMVLSVFLMAMIAYPLSRDTFKGKRVISMYLYFTCLFNGGLAPLYILITRYLHLADSIWVYILPSLVSAWNVFMMRTFFQGIPKEIIESAYVDGASELTIFLRMIIPLSKPVIATLSFTTFIAKWGDWNTTMLYINKPDLYSLQYLLQSMMKSTELAKMMPSHLAGKMQVPTNTARMAMALIAAGPTMLIFPFFQKYLVKGLTVGSVKG